MLDFKNSPLWIIAEMSTQNMYDMINIREIPVNLFYSAKDKYQLLCIMIFIKADKSNRLNVDHFNGIFYLNKDYYSVDDLNSNEINQINEYQHVISCIIYAKVFD
jgi:hypothetical protein